MGVLVVSFNRNNKSNSPEGCSESSIERVRPNFVRGPDERDLIPVNPEESKKPEVPPLQKKIVDAHW
ncbi:MAG: hypothetical protein NVSMB66_2340 [Candidatus Doudnabacteria bacterium]